MKRIAVTGGSGGAGRYVVQELLNHGYDVLNLDIAEPTEKLCPFQKIDLTNYQAVQGALREVDSVVHFASSPEPDFDFDTGAERFKNNTLATYNVFQAAAAHGFKRVVWASSETVLGFPFENNKPVVVPVTEDDAVQPQNSYALSKVALETIADHFATVYGVSIISLRYSNILYTHTDHPANYQAIPDYWSDPASRKFNLWGYVDARDSAVAARLALESTFTDSRAYIIAAVDTIMKQTNAELMAAVYPEVPIRPDTSDHQTLISIDKAKRELGYTPQYSWRNVLDLND
ncbi:UDP-glucose 4-epimerase [Neiella marina]|uniref:UDP-glucose 4-epimerase n=1 Tax=Neiella marina TaxID=508461 RepID=A0A8J2XMX2_9GAMM|nr:NAD(P)-dependent oxidoreductase [Neiella marina]GGA68375.1 UDP-glucose 4-epimerase [Neiella marina]